MNTAAKLGAYGACLAVVFGGAYAVGDASGAPKATEAPAHHGSAHGADQMDMGSGHTGSGHGSSHAEGGAVDAPAGRSAKADGYELRLLNDRFAPSDAAELRFQIVGPDGDVVERYDEQHDKELHLIVVRRDLSGYQHVHPVRSDDGTWSIEVDLGVPGAYRVLADFKPSGHDRGLTLGADVAVSGAAAAVPLPAPSTTAVVDGYEVTLEGRLVPGKVSPVTLTVRRDGRPVRDLQPYLAAYGHLVALRADDLAYLHVHPDGAPGDGRTAAGPDITFYAEVPTADTYRLYLDFRHGDSVHTAEFTVVAKRATARTSTTTTTSATGHETGGHGHPGEGS